MSSGAARLVERGSAHKSRRLLGEFFELDYDLLLYDVTSRYFEGIADPCIAKRGYSPDHRPDCVQVNIAPGFGALLDLADRG